MFSEMFLSVSTECSRIKGLNLLDVSGILSTIYFSNVTNISNCTTQNAG